MKTRIKRAPELLVVIFALVGNDNCPIYNFVSCKNFIKTHPNRDISQKLYTFTPNNIPASSDLLRIIGGNKATRGEFPFAVSLQTYKKNATTPHFSKFCGGTIIDPSWVLTAAHCIHEKTDEIYARAGIVWAFDNSTEAQVTRVVEKIEHPQYHPEQHYLNDIGLLKVDPPFNYTEYVDQAELPEASNVTYTGKGLIVGWGYLQDNDAGVVRSENLMKANIAIRTLSACVRYLTVTQNNICIGGFGSKTGSCKGDSGAPLLQYKLNIPIVIGLDSFGKATCGNKPTAYTNVSRFLDWIRATIDGESMVTE